MKKGKRYDKSVFLLLLPALFVLLFLFVYPFIYGFYLSITTKEGALSLSNYIRFFSDQWEYRTIWVTLYLSLPVTILCVAAAVPLAYYMRKGLKTEKLITIFLIIPITLGTVLVSEGMLTYLGPKGWLNQLLLALGLIKEPVQFTHNIAGVIISLFIQGFPFAFLMLLGYTSGINPNLEKAAQMLGASKWAIFRKIIFPLMTPGIAIAFCLNFVLSFSVFPSAVLLGQPQGATRVIAYAAYQWAYEKFDYHMGSTISLIMAVIEILIITVVLAWRQRMYKGTSMVGKG